MLGCSQVAQFSIFLLWVEPFQSVSWYTNVTECWTLKINGRRAHAVCLYCWKRKQNQLQNRIYIFLCFYICNCLIFDDLVSFSSMLGVLKGISRAGRAAWMVFLPLSSIKEPLLTHTGHTNSCLFQYIPQCSMGLKSWRVLSCTFWVSFPFPSLALTCRTE